MEQDFTKYNQALALRELGFDEPCFGYWNIDPYLPNPTFNLVKPFDHEWCIPAPLYQQAFRWFREKYELDYYHKKDWTDGVFYGYEVIIECVDGFIDVGTFNTYEEAESACLDKLIEIVKNK